MPNRKQDNRTQIERSANISGIWLRRGILIAIFLAVAFEVSGLFFDCNIVAQNIPDPRAALIGETAGFTELKTDSFATFENESRNNVYYRRWLAPLEHIWDWPTKDGPYVSIKRHRFERWANALNESRNLKDESKTNQLNRIVLEARLEDRQFEGTGIFEFRHSTLRQRDVIRNSITNENNPGDGFVVLDPLELWIGHAKWSDGTSARIVRTSTAETRLMLPENPSKSPKIRFDWSLRGRTDTQGRLVFDISLPDAVAIELRLDLPLALIPSVPVGLVLETPHQNFENDHTAPESSNISTPNPLPFRRWRVLPGQHTRTTLTLSPDESVLVRQYQTSFRNRSVYGITPQGTDLTSRFIFDKSGSVPEELLLDIESPLQVLEVQIADKPVPWTRSLVSTPYEGRSNSNDPTSINIDPTNAPPDVSERERISDSNDENNLDDGKRRETAPNADSRSVTRIRVDLSDCPKSETQEVIVKAIAPVEDSRRWFLPRIRAASPNLFWTETRCGVFIQNPLQARMIACDQGLRVAPLSLTEQTEREVFAFQFFEPDARISLDLVYQRPRLQQNSFTQIQWTGSEIKADLFLDCMLTEGELYVLELPVTQHWTINTVKCSRDDMIGAWDVLDSDGPPGNERKSTGRSLLVQLKRPLRPKTAVRFQVGGRFLAPPLQEYKLTDLVPLSPRRNKDESHLIALSPELPYRLQNNQDVTQNTETIDRLRSELGRVFFKTPIGSLFALDARSETPSFRIEQLQPNYSAEIEGTVQVREQDFVTNYLIRCQPLESNVDRVYVYFSSPPGAGNAGADVGAKWNDWQWSGQGETIQIQSSRLSNEQVRNLLSNGGLSGIPDSLPLGEFWEIRLSGAQADLFELRVQRSCPLTRAASVPLLSLPFASNQKGEIYIESSRVSNFQIINSRLTSIPIMQTRWNRYQDIRAAFRYHPVEEIRHWSASPLSLTRVSSEDVPPTAWAWTLRLDSQYENEGIVRNNAVYLIENRGKPFLRITLPSGVFCSDVHAVWLDDVRAAWQPDIEIPASEPATNAAFVDTVDRETKHSDNKPQSDQSQPERPQSRIVVIALPEGRRFVSVSLEYSFQDIPLTKHRNPSPRYPGIDIPVLAGNWTSWFPPDYEVSGRRANLRQDSNTGFLKVLNYYYLRRYFNPFSGEDWHRLFNGKRDHAQAVRATDYFRDWLTRELIRQRETKTETSTGRFPGDRDSLPIEKYGHAITWADLLRNERNLSEALARADWADKEYGDSSFFGVSTNPHKSSTPDRRGRIMIDKQAFDYYGLSPASPLIVSMRESSDMMLADFLEKNGLILLVSSKTAEDGEKEFVFYLTSFLMFATHRQFHSEAIANGIRYVPDVRQLDAASRQPSTPTETWHVTTELGSPQWMPSETWIRESEPLIFPWSVSSQIVRLSAAAPDWLAYDMSRDQDDTLYIVHRDTFEAYHLFAFLFALVLTWKRPFSSPILLIPLLILLEIWARGAVPCHLGIPSGAFMGVLVSLCFGFIRTKVEQKFSGGFFRQNLSVPGKSSSSSQHDIVRPESPQQHSPSGAGTSTELLPDKDEERKNPPENRPGTSIKTDVFFRQFETNVETILPSTQEKPDSNGVSDGSGNSPPISGIVFFAILLALPIFQGSTILYAQPANPAEFPPIAMQRPESYAPTVLHNESNSLSQTEPFRVFYPTDGTQRIVDDFVWLPERFFRWLHAQAREVLPKTKHRWSIAKAEYQATLGYRTLTTQGLGVSKFKAIYEIVMEEDSAAVALPSLPLVPDGAFWNGKPIQPVWRLRENREGSAGKDSFLVFDIENERPGRHVLELMLDPTLTRSEDLRQLSFDIPRIPDSILKIDAPIDSPRIIVTESLGAVKTDSPASSTTLAKIGPIGRIAFQWTAESAHGSKSSIKVDSLLRMHTRPLRIRAKFRYRIEGDKTKYLHLLMDPRWRLSGQFHCEEFPIERVETIYGALPDDELSIMMPGETARLVFKTPVSGTVTIVAGFMLRDFSGIGKVSIPRIRPLGAQISNNLLAVHGDPLLEIELPESGRSGGFESLWQHASTTAAVDHGRVEKELSSSDDEQKNETVELSAIKNIPVAVYDPTRTDPDWKISIRLKKTPPNLKLVQSYHFEPSESTYRCAAAFACDYDLFQQDFSLPDEVNIDSVELRDAEDATIECRWTEIPEKNVELQTRRARGKRYSIFFKRPVNGSCSIMLRGHFATPIPRDFNVENAPQALPMIRFDDSTLLSNRLELFRLPSILISARLDESRWKFHTTVLPISRPATEFAPIGIWEQKFAEPARTTLEADGIEAAIVENVANVIESPRFDIRPNRPEIASETMISVYRLEKSDSWEVVFDVLWTITNGELTTARFLWDDRCGSLASAEAGGIANLEQKAGQTFLTITPTKPLSDRLHFRFRASLDSSGSIVSIPKLEPICDRFVLKTHENYIVIPRNSKGIPIPWNLSSLAPLDEKTTDRIQRIIAQTLDEPNRSFENLSSVYVMPNTAEPLPFADSEDTEIERRLPSDALFFRATSDDFSASIAKRNERPVATLCDINIFIRKSNSLFGVLTVDLRSTGHDSCVLTMPRDFEIIQLISSGILSDASRLMDRRWKIDLFSSDYPQRITLIFRGKLQPKLQQDVASGETSTNRFPLSLSKSLKDRTPISIPFPVLENIDIRETLWTLSFEQDGTLPPISVFAKREQSRNVAVATLQRDDGEPLGTCVPLSSKEAAVTQAKLDLVRLNNLLLILDSLPVSTTSKRAEIHVWGDQWLKEWFSLIKMIDRTRQRFPDVFFSDKDSVLLGPGEGGDESEARLGIEEFLDSMKPADASYRALLIRQKEKTEELEIMRPGNLEAASQGVSPGFLVRYRDRMNENASRLFGASPGPLEEIRLVPMAADSSNFRLFLVQVLIYAGMPLILFACYRRFQIVELFWQFPHFWGMVLGLLLWCLSPAGIVGACLIVLILLSCTIRPWPKREITDHSDMLH